ncbi:transcription termination factor 1-like [Cololabis saira]|uniref:transcription termination factor 1-like n=1 Tax=Cololabis saira TaxID=129043 RepID=UPI002AD33C99|nr:transcription termination factor 1-like [Cololabis saira]
METSEKKGRKSVRVEWHLDPPDELADTLKKNKKKKKKRKKRPEEEEVVLPVSAEEPGDTPKKKKKRRLEEELIPPVNLEEPADTQKKKKKRRPEEELSLPARTKEVGTSYPEGLIPPVEEDEITDDDPPKKKKKKKRRQEEELIPPVEEEEITNLDTPKKKKKKRRQEEELIPPVEEEEITNLDTPKKKKKKKRRQEEELIPPVEEEEITNLDTPKKKKKKKRRQEEELIPPVEEEEITNVDTPKKKKKRRQEDELIPPVEEEEITNGDTPKKKKKKKKRRQEELIPAVEEEEITNVDTPKKKKKRRQEEELIPPVEEEEIANDDPPKKKKKKKRRPEEELIPPVNLEEPADTLEKKKKKRRQEEELIPPVEEEEITNGDTPPVNLEEPADTLDKNVGTREEKFIPPARTKEVGTSAPERLIPPVEEEGITNGDNGSLVTLETSNIKEEERDNGVEEIMSKEGKTSDNNKSIPETGRDETTREKTKVANDRMNKETENVDGCLVNELQEFIPKVKERSENEIKILLRYDLHRFKRFKQQGVPLRWGRYSDEENEQLKKNVSDFLALTGISSISLLLFPNRFPAEGPKVRKLKAQHHFLESIAEHIPRPCHQVYTRAKKIFDSRQYGGRFSKGEVASLVKLQTLHGNNWKAISEKMDRSVYALQKRFATTVSGRGPWNSDEESQLKRAVREHLQSLLQPGSALTKDQLFNNLPWKEISEKVQTRSWTQCRLKWFSILKNRLSSSGRRFRNKPGCFQAKILLINKLHESSVEDIADIKWNSVAEAVGNVTPVCVQKMFQRLKVSRVPNFTKLSYGEIINFLKDKVVPVLEDELKLCAGGEEHQDDVVDRYQLSDIFGPEDEL